MQEIVITLIEKFGYFGIAFLITLENVFPPIPSVLILTFGGFIVTKSKLTLIGVIISSTVGAVVGAIILYYIGVFFSKERLKSILSGKLGKVLRIKASDIDKADDWFAKKGSKAVFLCRFVPIVRSLISVPAGMVKMNFIKFLIYTTIGSLIWDAVLVVLGNKVGNNWPKICFIMDRYSNIIFGAIIIIVIIIIIKSIKKRRTNK